MFFLSSLSLLRFLANLNPTFPHNKLFATARAAKVPGKLGTLMCAVGPVPHLSQTDPMAMQ